MAVARRIASGVRERDGGLPRVQALGIDLASQGCSQVSMNVLDHELTPLWLVWERVGELARGEGVSMLDSELIGLAPARALTDVADHIGVATGRPLVERVTEAASWLRIRRFEPSMALEIRLGDGPGRVPLRRSDSLRTRPRCSSRTTVVSVGIEEMVTLTLGTGWGSETLISLRKRARSPSERPPHR